MDVLQEVRESVIEGSKSSALKFTQQALDENIPPTMILNEALIPAMGEIGKRFERKECFVPEMLLAARAMQAGVALLKPHMIEADKKPIGKIVLGTVKGDMHDVGKNLVGMMLEGAGFEIVDLGVDVPPDKFVQAVQQHHAQLLGLSALLTTTMPWMGKTITSLQQAGLRDQVKILVGGAPVTSEYARQIGADAYSADAASAVRVAKNLLEN
jgi:5-methyltetrahydrofolate--homocysteine methyltransferase